MELRVGGRACRRNPQVMIGLSPMKLAYIHVVMYDWRLVSRIAHDGIGRPQSVRLAANNTFRCSVSWDGTIRPDRYSLPYTFRRMW
jgi:hypothetical protein